MVLTIWPALFAGFHLLATRRDHPVEKADTSAGKEQK